MRFSVPGFSSNCPIFLYPFHVLLLRDSMALMGTFDESREPEVNNLQSLSLQHWSDKYQGQSITKTVDTLTRIYRYYIIQQNV